MSMFIVRVLSSLLLVEWSSLVAHNVLCLLRAGILKPRPVPDDETKYKNKTSKLHVTPA